MKTLGKIIALLGIITLLAYVLVDKYHIGNYFRNWSQEDIESNREEFIGELRQAMLDRKQVVELTYRGDGDSVHDFVGEAISEVFKIDEKDTSTDFDYLRYCYLGTEIKIQGMLDYYNVTYTFEYNETKEQTEQVDQRIKEVIEELDLGDRKDSEKVKLIHDYIVQNATYDVAVEKNSAYDNLINKSSVCQGYALLTYKMMIEAGIDCRIITGEGKGVSHAWNIVKIGDCWYNIDCTWDDPVSTDKKEHLDYTYFLKNDEDFKDHIRDEEFSTKEFYEQYPMADISY